ncbi:AAA family ATPase [Microcoleus sp. FACHB-68]|uniref:AAA family ATPase n=1 Tax=Microcoleus sp. FACHB-68 TaxID=2692826 RepID=UPI001682FC1F|nr:AAA family ATPase [Microcoleus sp. FACHB-68]MBD1935724.1 ATP-binding protein [Microcoleus sp. FACHB-68]
MKLTFVRPYKSITSFPETELADFIILTGVNGAGKTHLIEAIENGSIQIDNIALNNQTRPIRLYNWTNLVPQDSGAFSLYQRTQEKYGLWQELSGHIKEYRPEILDMLRQWNRLDLMNMNTRQLISMKQEDLIATGSNPEQAKQIIQAIQNAASSATQNVISRFIQNTPGRQPLINQLQENLSIPLIAFEEDDFYENFPKIWLSVDMFQQSFGRLFVEYQNNWLNNRLKALANSEGEPVSFLTNEEFLVRHGEPPWVFVNSILETANLDFRINQPPQYDDRPYEPILTDQVRGTQVKFADLSSGERILMSFALCLYYAEDRRQLVDYPEVLLFDEIDAPLHPSMTQSLLRTIQEVLINRHAIKVILTTHSPSTVALAPENSLYAMQKTDQQRLQKTTKDKALALLTTGVPTLSIDYENRRQVFVESQYDVQFYERIYEKLKDKLIPGISLNFISSGVAGKGNCEQVKEVVNRLYEGGNKTVYGIIDWDLKNQGNNRVRVLGKENRYSIENYIFDPLILTAFLLREKWIKRSEVGLSENETYIHVAHFDNSRLQLVADFIVDKVRTTYAPPQTEEEKQTCEYISGQSINLPVWFLQINGHQLENTIKETFPELKRFQKEDKLKREILLKVVDDIPQLLSKDFISLFSAIQNVNTALLRDMRYTQ